MADRRWGAALALALGACSQVPAYHVPSAPAPVAFKEAGPWTAAQPGGSAGAWWTALGDPALDALEARIDGANPQYAAALARRDEAAAQLRVARADALPQVTTNGQGGYDRQSADRPLRSKSIPGPDDYGTNTLSGSLSYELDLWGRVRAEIASGRGNAAASADDAAAIRLSLEADLADAWVMLRGLDAQTELLGRTIDTYQRADDLTRARFNGGIADGIDTGRSGSQLADAKAQLADVQAARARTEHAIAELVGVAPAELTIAPSVQPLALVVPDAGVPSALLQRRPDVAAAERRVFAANADIGQAKAAAYPQVVLGGSGGTQATTFGGLFSAANAMWAFGPSVTFPLFDGGRINARIRQARARWAEETADYRQTVLAAFQQVEDGLSDIHHIGDETAHERVAADQAAQTARLSMTRYEKGAASYLDVVVAQTQALSAERLYLQDQTARLQAGVGLVRALGGGWHDPAVAAAR